MRSKCAVHLGDERRLLACIGYELVEVLTQLSENEAVRPRLEMMLKDVLEEAEDAAAVVREMEEKKAGHKDDAPKDAKGGKAAPPAKGAPPVAATIEFVEEIVAMTREVGLVAFAVGMSTYMPCGTWSHCLDRCGLMGGHRSVR